MSKRKTGIAAVVVLLLIAAAAWAFWPRADAQVEKIKRMQDDMFAGGRPNPDQFSQFRKEMEDLSPEQRHEVHEHMRDQMERRMDKQIDDYFALPPEKRKESLDKQIRDQESRRKEWEKRRGQAGQGQGGAGQTPPPGAGQNASGGPPGGRNSGGEARSDRRNRMLDNTSPEQRAKRDAYRAAMQQRRIELGLPVGGGRRPAGR